VFLQVPPNRAQSGVFAHVSLFLILIVFPLAGPRLRRTPFPPRATLHFPYNRRLLFTTTQVPVWSMATTPPFSAITGILFVDHLERPFFSPPRRILSAPLLPPSRASLGLNDHIEPTPSSQTEMTLEWSYPRHSFSCTSPDLCFPSPPFTGGFDGVSLEGRFPCIFSKDAPLKCAGVCC